MNDREPNIHDHEWLVEEGLVPNPNELGTLMLPVKFRDGALKLGYASGALLPEDLHTSPNAERFWIAGDVTAKAHVTILYGLLTPAYQMTGPILRLLAGWRRPAWLPILEYEAFPSPFADEEYACIVARIGDRDGALAEARGLLEYLPHVNTFPEWKLHATVAYVKVEAADRWLQFFNKSGLPKNVDVPIWADGSLAPSWDFGSSRD